MLASQANLPAGGACPALTGWDRARDHRSRLNFGTGLEAGARHQQSARADTRPGTNRHLADHQLCAFDVPAEHVDGTLHGGTGADLNER